MGSAPAIDEAHDILDEYVNEQNSDYENGLYVWDALDKLSTLKDSDPEAFAASIGNLGGLAAANKNVGKRSATAAKIILFIILLNSFITAL